MRRLLILKSVRTSDLYGSIGRRKMTVYFYPKYDSLIKYHPFSVRKKSLLYWLLPIVM